jgi:hypothetical protein
MQRFASVVLLCTLCTGAAPAQRVPRNYVFFNRDREAIRAPAFSDSRLFDGAQIKYTWRELEPARDSYDFSTIAADLAFLDRKGKGLFLQIQDVSFDSTTRNVPDYILNDPAYHGGVDAQYVFANDSDAGPQKAGWVARRWDPVVAERFHLLLAALGKRFDGQVAGITLPETALDFGFTGKFYPKGFTPAGYVQAIEGNIAAAKGAFPRSVVIQYANFMPGGHGINKEYLGAIYAYAKEMGAGAGGPDVIPWRRAQMNHAYHFAKLYRGAMPLGFAVQEGNYAERNDSTGQPMTVAEIYDFAANQLGTDIIFWFPEEPYFSRDVVPFLRRMQAPTRNAP